MRVQRERLRTFEGVEVGGREGVKRLFNATVARLSLVKGRIPLAVLVLSLAWGWVSPCSVWVRSWYSSSLISEVRVSSRRWKASGERRGS